MDEFIQNAYISEVGEQVAAALRAVAELNKALVIEDVRLVLHALDDFLDHTARVSLLLWNNSEKYEDRGKEIRSFLKIEDDNPLKNRILRNHLQHFDERLDRWAKETKRKIFIDSVMGPRNFVQIDGEDPDPIMRHYVPDEKLYIFMGEEFQIEPMVRAVRELDSSMAEKLPPRPRTYRQPQHNPAVSFELKSLTAKDLAARTITLVKDLLAFDESGRKRKRELGELPAGLRADHPSFESEWNKMIARSVAEGDEQEQVFETVYAPRALALREEIYRRLGTPMPERGKERDAVALEYGLIGAKPLLSLAYYLEQLASRLSEK